jgi:hypothetical protein
MAGLTGRMSTVVKAKISKLLDRAEDPAETLDYSYEKQLEQLQNVKRGIADVGVVVVALVTLGMALEVKAKGRSSEASCKLIGVQAKTARVVRDGHELEDGHELDVLISQLSMAGSSLFPAVNALLLKRLRQPRPAEAEDQPRPAVTPQPLPEPAAQAA